MERIGGIEKACKSRFPFLFNATTQKKNSQIDQFSLISFLCNALHLRAGPTILTTYFTRTVAITSCRLPSSWTVSRGDGLNYTHYFYAVSPRNASDFMMRKLKARQSSPNHSLLRRDPGILGQLL